MSESVSSSVAVFGLGGTIAMTQIPGGGVSPALSAPELLAAVPGGEVTPVQLERIRPRTLVTLVQGLSSSPALRTWDFTG